jgi:hypothetical protein
MWSPSTFCIFCFTGMCLSIHIVYFMFLCCVCSSTFCILHTQCEWTNTYLWNKKYKMSMDKHMQVKYKIQNLDGQTHNSVLCYVFVHPDFVFHVSLLCICPSRCCILYFTVMCLSIQILYFMCHCYVFVQIVMDKYMSKIYHPLSYKQQHVGVTIILVFDG